MESVLASSTNPAHAALSPHQPLQPRPQPWTLPVPSSPSFPKPGFLSLGLCSEATSSEVPSQGGTGPACAHLPPLLSSFISSHFRAHGDAEHPPPGGGSPLPAQSLPPPTPPQGPSPSWWVGETRGQSSKVEAGGNPSRAWGGGFYFMDSWEPWRFYEQGSDESSPRKGPRPPGHHQMVTVVG